MTYKNFNKSLVFVRIGNYKSGRRKPVVSAVAGKKQSRLQQHQHMLFFKPDILVV